MPSDERYEVPGEPLKSYVLIRVGLNGKRISRVAEANTREELDRLHAKRLDWHYKLFHNSKEIDY
jgi:hypothetical protein